MKAPLRAVCFHGHFYQPPREHPWLGVVEAEPSAAPDRDWNRRITRECYAPYAAARRLDDRGWLVEVANLYEWTSFDVGPTLLAWFETSASGLLAALGSADRASRARTGWGNAWAQAFGHTILPLSTPRDVRTQVRWGRRDFQHRFGRAPEGMWLPEMAVDMGTLAALAEAGITLTMLAPHQAARIRRLGEGAHEWQRVTAQTLDTRRLYRCFVRGGGWVDIVFRDAPTSHEMSFGSLLEDGAALVERVRAAVHAGDGPALFTLAVDGETYGHHRRFGEMALGFAIHALRADPAITLAGPAAFRAASPAAYEVEIVERTSWSCPHGVERWRADCGCRTGGPASWSQAWRAPLRAAIDWLRDELAELYEVRCGEVLRDPWGARDRYIDCRLDPARTPSFLAAEAARSLTPAAVVQARRSLEMARHALAMQTSCGWFFDELSGVEPAIILAHAGRAIELGAALGRQLEDDFMARLEPAKSNLDRCGTGAELYRRIVARSAARPARVAATSALLATLGQPAEVPGYALDPPPTPAPGAQVTGLTELGTGAECTVTLEVVRPDDDLPQCRVGDETFRVFDLFDVQRERLLAAVGHEPVHAEMLPAYLAAAHVEAALLDRLSRLPASADEAIGLLDRAQAAGIYVDLSAAQVHLLGWWVAGGSRSPERAAVLRLAGRLRVAIGD